MECTRDNFRYLATEAKKRMKHGYWTNIISRRTQEIEDAKNKGVNTESIYNYYKHKVMSDFYRDCLPVSDEELIYSKVCKILDSGDNVTNILGMLMDRDYFNAADSEEKSRYIFKLSRLFVKMKQRYMMEKRN
ncbi:MAG: hypothetical protein ACOX3U_03425 [Christensenellales bacterium]|jgi:predicted YcjX-like family ATPase